MGWTRRVLTGIRANLDRFGGADATVAKSRPVLFRCGLLVVEDMPREYEEWFCRCCCEEVTRRFDCAFLDDAEKKSRVIHCV